MCVCLCVFPFLVHLKLSLPLCFITYVLLWIHFITDKRTGGLFDCQFGYYCERLLYLRWTWSVRDDTNRYRLMNRSEAAPKRIRTHTVTHRLLDINWKLRVQRSIVSAIAYLVLLLMPLLLLLLMPFGCCLYFVNAMPLNIFRSVW